MADTIFMLTCELYITNQGYTHEHTCGIAAEPGTSAEAVRWLPRGLRHRLETWSLPLPFHLKQHDVSCARGGVCACKRGSVIKAAHTRRARRAQAWVDARVAAWRAPLTERPTYPPLLHEDHLATRRRSGSYGERLVPP